MKHVCRGGGGALGPDNDKRTRGPWASDNVGRLGITKSGQREGGRRMTGHLMVWT